MKSVKYRKYYASRYKYPTRIIRAGINSGTLVIGYNAARRDIEAKLGRKLSADTKVRKAGGNWVFQEPRVEQAA